ncbi:MAG: hypothetical protein K8T25_07440 [Planctomycetia bacterium]|nr:hypothetical protein [Planctomycetia bacterium]
MGISGVVVSVGVFFAGAIYGESSNYHSQFLSEKVVLEGVLKQDEKFSPLSILETSNGLAVFVGELESTQIRKQLLMSIKERLGDYKLEERVSGVGPKDRR